MSGSDEDSDEPMYKEEEEDEEEQEKKSKKTSSSMNLTGFLFGNIDTDGSLRNDEDDSAQYLDQDSRAKLSGLAKMLDGGGGSGAGSGMPDLFKEENDGDEKVSSKRSLAEVPLHL